MATTDPTPLIPGGNNIHQQPQAMRALVSLQVQPEPERFTYFARTS
jgi:hypothetical protein